MRVRYYWSDDGVGECCEYQKVVTEQELECTHCLGSIPAGTEYVRLTASDGDVYTIHAEHEKRSIVF